MICLFFMFAHIVCQSRVCTAVEVNIGQNVFCGLVK